MAGIAFLLPNADMVRQAGELLQQTESHHVIRVRETRSETVIEEARRAIEAGANVIVARGNQAQYLRQETNVPIVEVTLTAQELGLVIVRAKEMLDRECPMIALIAWRGMLCDTSYFNHLFGIDVRVSHLDDSSSVEEETDSAIRQGADIIISGEKATEFARQKGVPALLLETTKESLQAALEAAEDLYHMSEIEKANWAQFSTLLDSSYIGIAKINEAGKVLLINRAMETMLQRSDSQVMGLHIADLMKELSRDSIDEILQGKTDAYTSFLNLNPTTAVVVVVEPVVAQGQVVGAILSCNQMKRLQHGEALHGYKARWTLEAIEKQMPGLKQVVDTAKRYAGSPAPLLLLGESTEDVEELCQGIHNYSLLKNGPYVTVNMSGIANEEQMDLLFGKMQKDGTRENGLIGRAKHGTLAIRGAERLTLQMQHHLLYLMSHRYRTTSAVESAEEQIVSAHQGDVRFFFCSSKSVRELLEQELFCADLYYLLSTSRIEIPSLSKRKEDIEKLLERCFTKYLRLYSRYHILSPEAKKVILEHPWSGHRAQIEAFVERMILMVEKRTITGDFVRRMLDELYGKNIQSPNMQRRASNEQERIRRTLEKFGGNRKWTAEALGMSTTTLWRKIKRNDSLKEFVDLHFKNDEK